MPSQSSINKTKTSSTRRKTRDKQQQGLEDDEGETVGCLMSRVYAPGEDVLFKLRNMVLDFAVEKAWVVAGGWSQQLFLRSLDPPVEFYDERGPSCKMSDLDVLCVDPLGDLIELAARMHAKTGTPLSVACGMMPNVYHLQVNWGGAHLVDALGAPAEVLDKHIPTYTHPWRGGQIRTTDPVFELAQLYKTVDNVFQLRAEESVNKRIKRTWILERALTPFIKPSSSSPTAPAPALAPVSDMRKAVADALRSSSRLLEVVAAVSPSFPPGRAHPWEYMVPTAQACEVLEVLVRVLSDKDRNVAMRLYAPFVWSVYVMFVDFVLGDQVVARVCCMSVPVALAPSSSSSSSSLPPVRKASKLTTLTHLYFTSMWRRSLGHDQDANARVEDFARVFVTLPPSVDAFHSTSLSKTYAGRLPTESLYGRYMQRRATNRPVCKARFTIEKSSPPLTSPHAVRNTVSRVRSAPGGRMFRFDGRLIATHPCTSVRDPKALLAALRAATDDHLMSEAFHPKK